MTTKQPRRTKRSRVKGRMKDFFGWTGILFCSYDIFVLATISLLNWRSFIFVWMLYALCRLELQSYSGLLYYYLCVMDLDRP
jgi:hypothetical protein